MLPAARRFRVVSSVSPDAGNDDTGANDAPRRLRRACGHASNRKARARMSTAKVRVEVKHILRDRPQVRFFLACFSDASVRSSLFGGSRMQRHAASLPPILRARQAPLRRQSGCQ
ncbi:hypothetical protein MRX96_038953 [Rhipicephalus microplus]